MMGSCASAARKGCKSPMPCASETAVSSILRVGRSCVYSEGGCGSGRLTTGVVRHACRLRRDCTRGWGGSVGGFNPLRGAGVGERVKESSPPSFQTSGTATTVTENNRRELFHPRRRAVSCEAALRILSNGEACPPCGGDSGYFHSAIAK